MHMGRRMCYVHQGWYTVDSKLCLCSDIKRARCLATNRCVNVRGVSQGIIWLERLGPRKSHCEPPYGLLGVALSVCVCVQWNYVSVYLHSHTHTHTHTGRYTLYTDTHTHILMRLIIIIYNQPLFSLWLTIAFKAYSDHALFRIQLIWAESKQQSKLEWAMIIVSGSTCFPNVTSLQQPVALVWGKKVLIKHEFEIAFDTPWWSEGHICVALRLVTESHLLIYTQ